MSWNATCAAASAPKSGAIPTSAPVTSRQQPFRSRHFVERTVAREVPCRQRPTEPLFKTTDAQTAAHWLHARSFPNLWLDGVDLRQFVVDLVDALIVPVTGESLLHLFPIEHARCRVDAAVNARPTLRHPASQIRLLHFVTPCDWRQATIDRAGDRTGARV
jgi:hypothetical protein